MDNHSQNLPYGAVCPLCCAIHLWMEHCRHEQFSAHELVQFTPEHGRELSVQSDTIGLGTLWSLMTSLRNSQATSHAVTHVIVGTKCTCNVSLSMITNRYSLPCDWGNGPMKSIPTDCHGLLGIGKLCRNPCGFCVLVLLV